MKRLLALLVFLPLMSSAALAQTTGALDPSPAPAKPSVSEDVPPGGCMPIGLTAAGEIVFPIQCRALIERARGNAVEQKPAAAGGKSATVEEKPAALEQKPAAVEEKPTIGEARLSTVEEKPAAAEAKPAAAEEKTAAKQSDDVAPEDSKPANQSLETVPLPKHGERRQRAASGESCT